MNKIWKYELWADGVADEVFISMPRGAKILTVQFQGGAPTIWAEVDPDERLEVRRFRIAGTGHPVTVLPKTYIGTCISETSPLVWHVYELSA